MKARIKATGKEIIVEPYGDEFAQILPDGDYKVYTKQELVFPNEVDWQHYRIQAAIAAMNGYQSAPIIPGCDPNPSQQEVARWSVQLADALIAELQKKQD